MGVFKLIFGFAAVWVRVKTLLSIYTWRVGKAIMPLRASFYGLP